jgi:NDP-sugar pyrophosphorylase family protein
MDLGARDPHDLNPTYDDSGMQGVRALVLVGGALANERFGEFPLALLDVLGRSVLMRTVDRLRAAGIAEISILSDTEPLAGSLASETYSVNVASAETFWEEAVREFRLLARQSECVLVLRLGAWIELDYQAIVDDHRRSGANLMRACTECGDELDIFVVSSGSQSQAAALLRGELHDPRISSAAHITYAYVNLLNAPESLRALTLDAFAGEAEIQPEGSELRPGVWVGKGAQVHRTARVVAPAYIGAFSNVHRDAVITRGSSLEHHTEVDCATVVENSNVLPYTRVGAGLDVEHSVLGFQRLHSLIRNTTVEIHDPHLVGVIATDFSARMLTGASWLLTFLPNAVWKLLFDSPSQQPAAPSETYKSSTSVIGDTSLTPIESRTKPYREVAASRRYGNQ